MVELLPRWALAPVVEAVQALRGISILNAITLIAEIGSFSRFENPRQLMAYLGLVPSEHSSGSTTLRGPITKTGNSLARTCLVEAASTYRFNKTRSMHHAHLLAPVRRFLALTSGFGEVRDNGDCRALSGWRGAGLGLGLRGSGGQGLLSGRGVRWAPCAAGAQAIVA